MHQAKSISTNLNGVSRCHIRKSLRLTLVLKALPQKQAGTVPRSRSRLFTFPNGVSNQMDPNHIYDERADRRAAYADAHLVARSKIGMGARAVNRLLWSLWLLLLPLIWPSKDWVGLLILSQAFFVAAKLIQPAIAETNSAASPAAAVIGMRQGENCAH